MFNFFKKKTKEIKPVEKKEKPTTPFEPEGIDKGEFYNISVQKTAKDFLIVKEGQTVALDSLDLQGGYTKDFEDVYSPNMLGEEIIFSYYARNGFIGFNNCSILAQDWLINKAVAAPCEDAISINYDVILTDAETTDEDKEVIEKLKRTSDESNVFRIKSVCREFAENKRKYGQALCIPIIEGVNYKLPFNIDAVSYKSYKGMSVIEPVWVAPVLDQDAITNPLSQRFYEPTWFRLPNGELVHYSWFIFNTYGDIPDILKPTYYFGGYPLPQLLYQQVYAAHKTAKEAPMLAQSKRLNYMEGNLNAFLGDENLFKKTLNALSWLRNNWGWLLIKKDQQIGQLDTSLADFDAVTMLGYQLTAAIAGVPSARLLETSPKGWQSTGSYEDRNYSKLQKQIQMQDFCPILSLHYKLLAKSLYDLNKSYTIVFDPIDTPTEKERAEIREINSRTDVNYLNAGVVSPDEIRDVIREDINSGYNVLAEEMEGEPVQDPEDPLGGSFFDN